MAFIDKQLTCRDCSKPFVFTGGEQEFYASKGLQNEPVRCPPCRTARKNNRPTEPEEGYVRYGVFASFGGRTPRQLHPATCAECGMMTEVPFQPRGDRPVYCSACYNKIRGAEAEAAARSTEKKASSKGTAVEGEEAEAEAPAAEVESPSEKADAELKELAEAAFPADEAKATTEEQPEEAETPAADETVEAEPPAAEAESASEETDEAESTPAEEEVTAAKTTSAS